MAFCRLVFLFVVLSVVNTLGSSQVPLFMWGDLERSNIKSNPLHEVTAKEFKDLLAKPLQLQPLFVVFIEEGLSVEDFSHRNAHGETSYPYLLANIGDSMYLPSVMDPLQVLDNLVDPERVDHLKLTESGLSGEIEPESGKILFISLKDAKEGESREVLLRKHNDFMEDVLTKLQDQQYPVIAIYTAHYPSWIIPVGHNRVRRQVTSGVSVHYKFENLFLDAKNMVLTVDNTSYILSNATNHSFNLNQTELSVTLDFENNKITLNFNEELGYWYFDSITLTQTQPESFTEDLKPTSEVFALNNFAYRCGSGVVFASVNASKSARINISDLQVQPFFTPINVSTTNYGDTFDCVGFFSAPIWACLFVVFILLSITFYGIMMMMDIRTNDRFDDPKGKTITINAGE